MVYSGPCGQGEEEEEEGRVPPGAWGTPAEHGGVGQAWMRRTPAVSPTPQLLAGLRAGFCSSIPVGGRGLPRPLPRMEPGVCARAGQSSDAEFCLCRPCVLAGVLWLKSRELGTRPVGCHQLLPSSSSRQAGATAQGHRPPPAWVGWSWRDGFLGEGAGDRECMGNSIGEAQR